MTTKKNMKLRKDLPVHKIKMGHLLVSHLSYSEILSQIDESIHESIQITIGCVNVYYFIESRKNRAIAALYNSFEILHPDGVGVRSALRFLYSKETIKEKMTGTDLYYKILYQADRYRWSLFLFGDTQEVIQEAKKEIENEYPNITICGAINGYDKIENDDIVRQINDTKPDILFIGLGLPRQEYWIGQHRSEVHVPVCVSVGGGIAFISKLRKRAPALLRKAQIEWLYRLFQDPFRLWKRYILGIPYFIYLMIIQKLKISREI